MSFSKVLIFMLLFSFFLQSRSQILLFDFVIQWQVSVCNFRSRCLGLVENDWSIHGLWQRRTVQAPAGSQLNLNTKDPLFLASVYPDLVVVWPDCTPKLDDENFWGHEWTEHGYKSGFDECTYFQHAVDLYQDRNVEAMTTYIYNNFHPSPNGLIDLPLMDQQLQQQQQPRFPLVAYACNTYGGNPQLKELKLQFEYNTVTAAWQWVDYNRPGYVRIPNECRGVNGLVYYQEVV